MERCMCAADLSGALAAEARPSTTHRFAPGLESAQRIFKGFGAISQQLQLAPGSNDLVDHLCALLQLAIRHRETQGMQIGARAARFLQDADGSHHGGCGILDGHEVISRERIDPLRRQASCLWCGVLS